MAAVAEVLGRTGAPTTGERAAGSGAAALVDEREALRRGVAQLVVCAVAGAVFGLLAGLFAQRAGLASAEGAWRAVRAARVVFGAPPSIAALGFDLAPLTTLLQIPLLLVPALRTGLLAAAVVAGSHAAMGGWAVFRAARAGGAPSWQAVALGAAYLLNPLTLYGVATGASVVSASAWLAVGVWLCLAWLRRRSVLALIGAGTAWGVGGLAAYRLFLVAMLVAGVLGWMEQAGMQRAARGTQAEPQRAAAVAVTFATPVGFWLGLWLLLNLMTTGEPAGFVGRAWGAVAAPGAGAPAGGAMAGLLPAAAACAAGMALLAWRLAWRSARRTAAQSHWALLGALLLALGAVDGVTLAAGGGTRLIDLLMVLPAGLLAIGLGTPGTPPLRRLWPVAGTLGALGVCLVSAELMLHPANGAEWGEAYRPFTLALLGRAGGSAGWAAERAVAAALRDQLGQSAPAPRSVLVDDRASFLPLFFAEAPRLFITTTDADFGAVVSRPDAYAALVLVYHRLADRRHPADQVEESWPKLAAGDVYWAQLAARWSVPGAPEGEEYRLYRVRPAPASAAEGHSRP